MTPPRQRQSLTPAKKSSPVMGTAVTTVGSSLGPSTASLRPGPLATAASEDRDAAADGARFLGIVWGSRPVEVIFKTVVQTNWARPAMGKYMSQTIEMSKRNVVVTATGRSGGGKGNAAGTTMRSWKSAIVSSLTEASWRYRRQSSSQQKRRGRPWTARPSC